MLIAVLCMWPWNTVACECSGDAVSSRWGISYFQGSLENMNAVCSEAEVTCLQVLVGGKLFFENYLLIGWFMWHFVDDDCCRGVRKAWFSEWIHSEVSSLHLSELSKGLKQCLFLLSHRLFVTYEFLPEVWCNVIAWTCK